MKTYGIIIKYFFCELQQKLELVGLKKKEEKLDLRKSWISSTVTENKHAVKRAKSKRKRFYAIRYFLRKNKPMSEIDPVFLNPKCDFDRLLHFADVQLQTKTKKKTKQN